MKLAAAAILLASSVNGEATFHPGDFSDGNKIEGPDGQVLYLTNGLECKAVAWSGQAVTADDGTDLGATYHENCDGGAAIPKADGSGYIYVSNSEIGDSNDLSGGSYAMEFDSSHNLLGYKQVLSGTAKNCHGGETPWGTWVSCEEDAERGRCWQVDPTGEKEATVTALTGQTGDVIPGFGKWEAFAWDSGNNQGYVTNDDFPVDGSASYLGAIVQYTPDETALACLEADDKWCALDSGTVKYLKLNPESDGARTGTFEWVDDVNEANPELYGGNEGAHFENGIFTFGSLTAHSLFRLKSDGTYVESALPFSQEPDNLRLLGDVVYLCTDGDDTGVDRIGDALYRWDATGASRLFYEIGHSYPAGPDFSPDKSRMFISMYGHATYSCSRSDGMLFDDAPADITYEVMGGVDEGKTPEDVASEVAVVDASVKAMSEGTKESSNASGGETIAEAAEGGSGASSNIIATATMGAAVIGTLML